jgi:transcriptional regulator with XRE-family HTH domain
MKRSARPQPAIGAAIRALREKRGMTQETLASDAKTTLSTLSVIERGLANPTWANRARYRHRPEGLDRRAGKALREARIEAAPSGAMRPGCDHDAPERLGIARKATEPNSEAEPKIWLHTRKSPAPRGTATNAPDGSRTRDLRLERPTLFGPPKGPVDH